VSISRATVRDDCDQVFCNWSICLHRLSGRVGIDELRVSADLALLTPLLFMLWFQVK